MKKVFQKLLNVKQKIDYIQKSTAGHNYNYASPSVVLAKLNPLLNEEKVIIEICVQNV